jgi:hypothetical protein
VFLPLFFVDQKPRTTAGYFKQIFNDLSCRSNHVENSKRRRRYGRAPLNTSIEHPTKFDVVTNLEALGLTISQTLLAAADEVVE